MKKSYISVFVAIFFAIWFVYDTVVANEKETKLNISEVEGSINCYFNKFVDKSFASNKENYANGNVNLEEILLKRINQSKVSIDLALYELNLMKITDALIEKASQGVTVRAVFDAKKPNPKDKHYVHRYKIFRLHIEKLMRGKDKKLNTADDVNIFADGVIFPVEDNALRESILGKGTSLNDFEFQKITIGKKTLNRKILTLGEYRNKGESFYSGNEQMHNKYFVIDNKIVWTGSWNLTVTGIYGSEENQKEGKFYGNAQHSIEIIDSLIAKQFTKDFENMWGSSNEVPNYNQSVFHSRKKTTSSKHLVGGEIVELYFPAGEEFLDRMDSIIKYELDKKVYFAIFAWSYQPILNSLKDKCDKKNGLELRGVFDDTFWNQWWSASYDMRGKTKKSSKKNPSVPWSKMPDIYKDGVASKMHAKTMIIDADTDSDPTVITGSANWSENSASKNDENVVIIHSKDVANQFTQAFFASYNLAKQKK